jgi:hypothetical protein
MLVCHATRRNDEFVALIAFERARRVIEATASG